MGFVRQYRFVLLFLALLVFCSVMVVRQLSARHSRHVEIREAFILLQSRGYTNEAQRLYEHLLREMAKLSDRALLDDFQRTLVVVDPGTPQPKNLIWLYHWTVSTELDRRSVSAIRRARKLAEE